jgi:two-component system, NarL family, invasion response regulator UvrY
MRLLIIDDHPIMRFGVAQMLLRAWPDAVLDEAATLEEGIARFNAQRPDVVILDLSLPDATGVEGATRMLRITKGVPILVLSLNSESTYAARLLQMGVAGYLQKDRAGEELFTAIERLLQGRRYVTPAMADRLLGLLEGKSPNRLPHEALATQEHRVMLLIAAGKTPAEIAELMHLSVKTVGTYRARIFEKTGWKNNTELTKYCVQHGLTALD